MIRQLKKVAWKISVVLLSTSTKSGTEKRKRAQKLYLPVLALVVERTGVSDRAAAIIANATLEDMGLISYDNKTKVINRMTLRRQKEKNKRF